MSRASIRLGFSLRLHRYSWGVLHCFIKNPDDIPHKITLRLFTETGFSQSNVFSDDVISPPKSALSYYSPVMVENSENYRLEIYIDGKKISKTGESVILRLISNQVEQIAVVNSSTEISFGSFTQIKEFKKKLTAVHFSGTNFPENWSELKNITAIVMLVPDYDSFSARQFRALLDYVRQGGIIIFAYPDAITGAMNTPLAELLPVNPIRIRYIQDLKCLRKTVPEFKGWDWKREGVPFIESTLKPGSVEVLKENDFPVYAWKKYGLGSCRMSAVPLSGDFYQSNDIWKQVLKRFFMHQKLYFETEPMRIGLDQMTGFTIPKIGVVRAFFFAYFALLAIVMFLGFVIRKPRLAWTFAAVWAICATFYIIQKAASSSKHKGQLLAAIECAVKGSESLPINSYYGLFSSKDSSATVKSGNVNSVLSSIPPDNTSFMQFNLAAGAGAKRGTRGKGASSNIAITESFEIQRINGEPQITDMVIRANTARQFNCLLSTDSKTLIPVEDFPVLTYKKNSIKLNPWDTPEEIDVEHAFILFPSGSYILNNINKRVSLSSLDEALFHLDGILKSIQKALDSSYKKTSPCLALVEQRKKTFIPVPKGAECQGRRIHIIPVREVCEEKDVYIGPKQIVLTPGDTFTRMIMTGNRIKSSTIFGGVSNYTFQYQLPPLFSKITPEEIKVQFSYFNQGGNIIAEPALIAGETQIKGKSIGNDTYVFKGKSLKKAIDPATGHGLVMIISKQQNRKLSQAQKLRANKWSINNLAISIKGTLPEQMVPFEY